MSNGFDLAAINYDTSFTHTPVGRLQRNRVYHFLNKKVFTSEKKQVLEVNCGTGEDALWLSKKCSYVFATDLSVEMLQKAKAKTAEAKNIEYKKLDLIKFEETNFDTKFDFIFSNFGGLNCIEPQDLEVFIKISASKLNTKGQLAMVIMPRKCFIEQLYFLLKRDRKNAFRRKSKKAIAANVEDEIINTWYYDPKEIMSFAKQHFKIICSKPIGLFVPPSYLNTFFKKRQKLLSFLGWIDKRLDYFDSLSRYADHFIIILEKR